MARLAKCPAMVQVYWICVVAKQFECFIVMTVHVPHQEVKDGQVHHIQQSSTLVVWADIFDYITVIRICFPSCFPPFVIASSPRMSPSFPRHHGFTRKKCGKAPLQHVGAAADGVGGVTIIRTLAVEAQISCRRNEKCL